MEQRDIALVIVLIAVAQMLMVLAIYKDMYSIVDEINSIKRQLTPSGRLQATFAASPPINITSGPLKIHNMTGVAR